jgi:ankyrin repeat protein
MEKVNNSNVNNCQLLHYAVQNGDYKTADYLLKNGCSIYCAAKNKDYKMVKLLLEYEPNIDQEVSINI